MQQTGEQQILVLPQPVGQIKGLCKYYYDCQLGKRLSTLATCS